MESLIDFHSHILPNVDDGSRSVSESIAMLRQEAAQGITDVVATPHFYPSRDDLRRFLERRNRAWEVLMEALPEGETLPRIHLGAEVYYFRGISNSELLVELSVAGKQSVLVELPYSNWTPSIYRELECIWENQGIQPIIAHVDRYISPLRTHGIPEALEKLPVLVQANAQFFLNWVTSSMAVRMLRKGQIHLLGSDCHNMDSRLPNLGPALSVIERKLGKETIVGIRNRGREVLGLAEARDVYGI